MPTTTTLKARLMLSGIAGLALFVGSSSALASGSSIGNGGRQLCVEGATEILMESDTGGDNFKRVTYTCYQGRFQNRDYHPPTKTAEATCAEGHEEVWASGEVDIGGSQIYICHNGVYKKKY